MQGCVAQILAQLNLPAGASRLSDEFLARAARPWELIPGGHQIGPTEVLFQPMSPELGEELRIRSPPPLLPLTVFATLSSKTCTSACFHAARVPFQPMPPDIVELCRSLPPPPLSLFLSFFLARCGCFPVIRACDEVMRIPPPHPPSPVSPTLLVQTGKFCFHGAHWICRQIHLYW